MIRLTLLLCVLATACKSNKDSPAPAAAPKPTPAETPTPVVTTPPAGSADTGSAAMGSAATGSATAGSAATAPDGLMDWCKTRAASFDKARCKNGNTDECFCEVGTHGREGQLVNGPDVATGTSATILEAKLVRVVDNAKDPIQCGVAAKTASGWLVAERQFKCGRAAAAPESAEDLNVDIDAFTIDDKGIHLSGAVDAFKIDLDDSGHAKPTPHKATKFNLTCTVAGSSLSCKSAK